MSDILQKQERLQKMREDKRLRDLKKKQQEERITGGNQVFGGSAASISNKFIEDILNDKDPFQVETEESKVEVQVKTLEELKTSTYVVDMEIPAPIVKPECYDAMVQCSIIDASMVKYLQTIKEEEEHDMEGNNYSMELINMSPAPGMGGVSPDKMRKKSFIGGPRSFIGGSFIGEELAPAPVETEQQKAEREKQEFMDSFKILSKEESKLQMQSKAFDEFLSKTGRIVERALDTEFDVVGDFFADEEEEEALYKKQKGDKISQQFVFQPTVNVKRAVTSMDWSPKVGELLMVSYSKCSEFRYDEPDGLVNIFSLNLKSRPEISLTCQNEVTKAIFNPHQPNCVIGATQSGFIVQWDIRAKTTPVQKSTLAKDGHSHPIHALAIVGTKNAHNIVSISNDSKICQWHFGELSNPKISFNLFNQVQTGQQTEQTQIRVNSMEFPEDETDKFYIGAEDYNIYQANLHASNIKDKQQWKAFSHHCAPVTKISMHPGKSMSENKANSSALGDMSELMLSASMDWTVKLWYPKQEQSTTPIQPIYTFESSQEYVYDVQWSPVHPSVFAQVDGDGYVDVWDINRDTESPIAHKKAFESSSSSAYKDFDDTKALSCLRWSRDGRRIAIGDSEGYVSIWQAEKDLYMPKQNDFDKIEELIKSNSTQEQKKA